MRSQRGQSNVEYLAALSLVALVFGIFVLVAPKAGEQLACGVRDVIADVTGNAGLACSADQQAGDAFDPCVVRDRSGELSASVTIIVVKGGGKVQLQKQRMSDGTYKVTAIGGGELGLEVGSPGARAEIKTGKDTLGASGGAEASATGQAEYGATWEFDNEKAADRQLDILKNRLRDGAVAAAGGPVGGFVWDTLGLDDDRPLGSPKTEYFQGGLAIDASAAAKAGGGGGAEVSGGVALGRERDNSTGDTTTYFLMEGEGNFAVKALKGWQIQPSGSVQVSVKRDKDGVAQEVKISHMAGAQGDVPLPGWLNGGAAQTVTQGLAAGGRLETDVILDLTDPAARAAYDAFTGNPLTGTDDLVGAFVSKGKAQARVYTGGKGEYGLALDGKLGGKLGFDVGYTGESADLGGAWEYTPDGGLRESITCKA